MCAKKTTQQKNQKNKTESEKFLAIKDQQKTETGGAEYISTPVVKNGL